MSNPADQNLLEEIQRIARQAGDAIMSVYQIADLEIMQKPDKSLVTEADLLANDLIEYSLLNLPESLPIVAEESPFPDFSLRREWDRYWLIDPLDGTKEFINQTGDFSVNLALIDTHQPVLGVVYFPATNTLYYAQKNLGAFKVDARLNRCSIQTRSASQHNITLAISRRRQGPLLKQFLTRLGSHQSSIHGGCLKSCLVAEGKADASPCFGPTYEWDTAAAQIILTEAGGSLLDLNLQPLQYNLSDSLINSSFIAVGDPHYDWRRLLQ